MHCMRRKTLYKRQIKQILDLIKMVSKIVKVNKVSDRRLILAICDSDLVGKKFDDGKLQLDLTGEFYQGEEMDDEKIMCLLPKTYILNLVGKESVDFGVKHELVENKNIKKVKNIPHAQVMLLM